MTNDPSTGSDKNEAPWESEPDREIFSAHGFTCLVNRAVFDRGEGRKMGGYLCGYVAVPKGHPWYGKHRIQARVHGGVTYTEHCQGDVCHDTEGDDDVWWVGFDCNHAWDVSPYTERLVFSLSPEIQTLKDRLDEARKKAGIPGLEQTYRTFRYVRQETINLARQAAEAAQ